MDAHPWRRRQHLPHVPGLHYQGEIFVFLSRFYPLLIIFIKCNKFPFKSLFVQLMSMYTPFFAQLLSRRTSFPTWATTHTGGTRMVSWSPPWKWIHLPDFLSSTKMFFSAFLISLKCHDEVICCDISNLRLWIKAFDLLPFTCEDGRPNIPAL